MNNKTLASIFLPMIIFVQYAVAQDQTEQDQDMCKYAADHMIEVAKQSLTDKNSRPERTEKRRKLVENWSARMEDGEDPCNIYADIQKEATNF